MKDEAAGNIIEEVFGLSSKLYSYNMFSGKESKKCKGVTKSVINKKTTHEDYKDCLLSRKEAIRKMNVIRSRKHKSFQRRFKRSL